MLNLGLFIPVLYALTFWLICLFTNTIIVDATLTLFFLGLGLTTAAGLMFAFYRFSRRSKKKTAHERPIATVKPMPVKKPKGTFRGGYKKTVAEESDAYAQADNFYADDADFTEADTSYSNDVKTEAQAAYKADLAKLHAKYFGTPKQECDERNNVKAVGAVASTDNGIQTTDHFGAQKLWERLEGASLPKGERPMIFKLHCDSNIYVCEYSDRLQFWERKGQNMALVKTEFKTQKRVK